MNQVKIFISNLIIIILNGSFSLLIIWGGGYLLDTSNPTPIYQKENIDLKRSFQLTFEGIKKRNEVDSTLIKVASLTNFDWEKLHIFQSYEIDVDKKLGFQWANIWKDALETENMFLFVFTKNKESVSWFLISPAHFKRDLHINRIYFNSQISRNDIFRVKYFQSDRDTSNGYYDIAILKREN